jgi:biotin carboxyl carrier protein
VKTYHIRLDRAAPGGGPSPDGVPPGGTVVEVALDETPEGLRATLVHYRRAPAGPTPMIADAAAADGRRIDLAELMPGWYSVIIAGRSHTLGIATWRAGAARPPIEAGARHWTLVFDGEAATVDVMRSAQGRLATSAGTTMGAEQVRAPMPGLVVAIQAEPGTAVAAGQPLIIMEAMKMQMEIRAPRAGVIREMRVAPGQDVAGNDVLATLE